MFVIPAKVGIQRLAECPRHWMIRFAHPFGAILRMFSALRATSSFRWDDGSVALNLQVKIAQPGYISKFFLAIHVFSGQH